jgi:hypothetical protein
MRPQVQTPVPHLKKKDLSQCRVSQVVELLPSKHEALTSIPSTTKKKTNYKITEVVQIPCLSKHLQVTIN